MKKIKILLTLAVSVLIFQGCSNKEHNKLMLYSKTMFTVDTVPMSRINPDAVTFSNSVKKSLENMDFNNINLYLDSTVAFSVRMGEHVYHNQVKKEKIIEAINNILENSQMSSYTLYKTHSENDSSSVFYLLVMHVIFNESETEVNILFTMQNETINSVQLY
jgi:hypothetical protein